MWAASWDAAHIVKHYKNIPIIPQQHFNMKLSESHIESKYDILKLSYIGTTLLMALTVFVILRFLCPCLLSNHEQYQLFLWSSDYALSRFVQPGGIARYVAEFVVQYYNNFLVGSILITILFAIMQLLSLKNVLRFIGNGWQSLTLSLLVPMIMMLINSLYHSTRVSIPFNGIL